VRIIFVSFETLRKPAAADVFVEAWSQNLQTWQRAVVNCARADPTQSTWAI
jgi:elongator complex protein 5